MVESVVEDDACTPQPTEPDHGDTKVVVGEVDSRSPGRRLARALALVVCGLLLGVVSSEGLFRVAMRVKPSFQNLNPPTLVEDPITEHTLLPGITTRYISPEGEFDSAITISSQGLHDREYPLDRPPGTYRILVVGDSLVEGLHVALAQTFPKLLEQRLNGRRAGGLRFEVLNAGISGMSPVLEYLGIRDKFLRFHPDLVLLCVFPNDVSEDQAYRPLVAVDGAGRPLRLLRSTSRTAFVPLGLKIFLKRHSRLGVFLMNLYHFPGGFARHRILTEGSREWTPGEPPGDIFASLREPATPRVDAAWAFTTRILDHTASLLEARGVRFALAIIPAPNQVSEREWARGRKVWRLDGGMPSLRPQAILARWGRQRGVPTLDMVSTFRASREFPLFFPYDGHFTAAGHRAAADALYDFSLRQVWFPRS